MAADDEWQMNRRKMSRFAGRKAVAAGREWIKLAEAHVIVMKRRELSSDAARTWLIEAVRKGAVFTRGQYDRPRANLPFLINPPAWEGMVADFESNLLIPVDSTRRRPPGGSLRQLQFVGTPIIHDVRVHVGSLTAFIEDRDPPPLPQLLPLPPHYNKGPEPDPAILGNPLPDFSNPAFKGVMKGVIKGRPQRVPGFVSWEPSQEEPEPAAPVRSTIGAETECRKWLTDLMQRGDPVKPKAAYREEAKAKWGIGIRAFDRAWAQAIVDSKTSDWGKPGRKS